MFEEVFKIDLYNLIRYCELIEYLSVVVKNIFDEYLVNVYIYLVIDFVCSLFGVKLFLVIICVIDMEDKIVCDFLIFFLVVLCIFFKVSEDSIEEGLIVI